MNFFWVIYIIGFVAYLLKYISETYSTVSETEQGTGSRVFMTFIMTLMVGPLYAIFWPIIYFLEWRAEENKELEDKIEQARQSNNK